MGEWPPCYVLFTGNAVKEHQVRPLSRIRARIGVMDGDTGVQRIYRVHGPKMHDDTHRFP